jgi:predicted transcriptional regulator
MNKLNEIGIASLHPEKEVKFRKMINSAKESHYSPRELKELLLKDLNKFRRTSELADKFKRSDLRILEVLQELKKENKVDWIKLKGRTCWAKKQLRDKYLYDEKVNILKHVVQKKNMTQIGKLFNVSRKAIKSKLIKLENEGVVKKESDKWMLSEKGKTILGIDESGSVP